MPVLNPSQTALIRESVVNTVETSDEVFPYETHIRIEVVTNFINSLLLMMNNKYRMSHYVVPALLGEKTV